MSCNSSKASAPKIAGAVLLALASLSGVATAQYRVAAPPEVLTPIGPTGSVGKSVQGPYTVEWKVLDDGTRLVAPMAPLKGDSLAITPLPACSTTVLCKAQGPDLRPVTIRVLNGWNPPLRFVYEIVVANEGRAATTPAEVRICPGNSCGEAMDVVVIPAIPGRSTVTIRRAIVPQSEYPPSGLAIQVDADRLSGDAVPQNNGASYPFPPLFAQEPRLVLLSTTFLQNPTAEQVRRNEPTSWTLTLQNSSAGSETGPLLTQLKLRNGGASCARRYSGDPVDVALPSIPPKATVLVTYQLPPWYQGCAGYVGSAGVGLEFVRSEAIRARWNEFGLVANWSMP